MRLSTRGFIKIVTLHSSIDKPLDRNYRDVNAHNAGGQILPTQLAQQSRWTVIFLDRNNLQSHQQSQVICQHPDLYLTTTPPLHMLTSIICRLQSEGHFSAFLSKSCEMPPTSEKNRKSDAKWYDEQCSICLT